MYSIVMYCSCMSVRVLCVIVVNCVFVACVVCVGCSCACGYVCHCLDYFVYKRLHDVQHEAQHGHVALVLQHRLPRYVL